jgi:hypothetical protein
MPKAKKVVKKTARKTTRKSAPKKAISIVTGRPTGFLAEQQEAFHKAHPNANMLIGWLLVLFAVLVVVYVYQNGADVQEAMNGL